MNKNWAHIFDKISFASLLLVVTLLPIFLLPYISIPIETSKGLLLVMGLVVSLITWALARFSDGKINVSKSWLLFSGIGIVVVFFLSALTSGASGVSLFGVSLDIGSFSFIFASFLLLFMSSIVFKDSAHARTVLIGLITSSILALVFQAFRLFFPQALSLGVLGDKTSNIIGSWNAFGFFAGFSIIISLLLNEFFAISKSIKWVLRILTLLGIAFIIIVNYILIWEILGIFALIIFVYKISITSHPAYHSKENQEESMPEKRKSHFPVMPFVVVMVALLFFTSGNFVVSFLPDRLQLSNNELSPSFAATVGVTKGVLSKNPFLGIGPNRFPEAWALYKPAVVNESQFWDVSFSFGSGLLPTLASTNGFLGMLSLLLFFAIFLASGIKSLFSSMKKGLDFEMAAFFILALYLFVVSAFYTSGIVIFLLAMALSGIFIGLSRKHDGEVSVSFLNDHRKSFFSILLLVSVIIIAAALCFKYIERFASVSYFEKALGATSIPVAENNINKALALHMNDLYLRTYAQIYILKLSSLVSQNSTLSLQDKADVQTSFNLAVDSAQSATAYNGENYLNFQTLGSVFQAAGSFGVKDAYTKAFDAYKTASTLNPLNPGINLNIASVSLSSGREDEAKSYVSKALALKPDYINGLISMSQILKNEGDLSGALDYAQKALELNPSNKDLIQYVNSLKNSNAPIPTPAPTTTPLKPKK